MRYIRYGPQSKAEVTQRVTEVPAEHALHQMWPTE